MSEDTAISVDIDRMTFGDLLLLDDWPKATWAQRIEFLKRVVVEPDVLTLPVSAMEQIFDALKGEQERKRNPENLP